MDFSTSTNATIISFPPFSGGKFLSNCLSLSARACPQDPETARHVLIDPCDYDYRLSRVLGTLPSRDKMSVWRSYEFGDTQIYGSAFHSWKQGQPGEINPLTQELAVAGMKFFISDHSMEPLGLVSVWSSATIIRFVNSRRFQDLCMIKKNSPDTSIVDMNGNYCQEKYDQLRGPDWPQWSEFDRLGYDITQTDVDPEISGEISKFYRVHLLENPVLLYDVDLCYFDRDRFMKSVETLYQQLGLPDFQLDLVGTYYDKYIQLHL